MALPGGSAIQGTMNLTATTLPIATWICGGRPRVRTPSHSMMGGATTIRDHIIARLFGQRRRRRFHHRRHQCQKQRATLAVIAPHSDGTPFGNLRSLSFVQSQARALDVIATLAPHGDW